MADEEAPRRRQATWLEASLLALACVVGLLVVRWIVS